MLSGKVAPSEWKSWTVFHGTPEKHKVAMGFVFVGGWAEWWLLLVCIWFHFMNSGFTSWILVSPRVVSLLSFYFFFFPLSNLQNFMPGKFPYSSEAQVLQSSSGSHSCWCTGACWMLLSFGVCSHRETKKLEVIGRGLLVKLQCYFIWWEAKKAMSSIKKP